MKPCKKCEKRMKEDYFPKKKSKPKKGISIRCSRCGFLYEQ